MPDRSVSFPWTRFSVSIIFFVHGFIVATWASRIPYFQASLHLSPAIVGRTLMMAAIGSVVAMPVAGWIINRIGSMPVVIATSLGFALSLPWIAETNTVAALSVALLFYGAMGGSLDVAMNTHAALLEKLYQRHIMVSFHALFSFGGVVGAALGGLLASRGITPRIHYWACGLGLLAMAMVAYRWLRLPAPVSEVAHSASRETLKWSITLGAIALLAFSFMLVEGAMVDWSAIYLRSTIRTGPGVAVLGYAFFSAAMCAGRVAGDSLNAKLGRAHLVRYGALLAAAGLVVVLLFGNAGGALLGFTFVGAGLATIVPNAFAAGGNIKGSAPGPSLAVVTTAGYLGFLAGPPMIGFVAQYASLPAAFWLLATLSAVSALAAGAMNRTTPLVKSP